MAAREELKNYLTPNKLVITNEQGFRLEYGIPLPGNMVVFHVGQQSVHVGHFPTDPPRSPTGSDLSDLESDNARSPSPGPSGTGGPEDPIEI